MPGAIPNPSTGEVILKNLQPDEIELIKTFKAELTEDEIKAIEQFATNGDVDSVCWRYLRARKYTVDVALKLLRTTLEWRAESEHLKKALEFKPTEEQLQKWEAHFDNTFMQGTSKHNHVVGVDRTVCRDLGKLRAAFNDDELKSMWVMHNEYRNRKLMKDCSDKSGHTIDKQVSIIDVKGIGMGALRYMGVLSLLASIDQYHYPETMYKIIIVHAPGPFAAIWSAVSQLLDKRTIDKVSIVSTNGAKEIMELVDAAAVPEEYGGTAGPYADLRRQELDQYAQYCGHKAFPWPEA